MSSSLARSPSKLVGPPELPAPTFAQVWRDVVHPREHGSWSLAFEPVALGLAVAPSVAGGLLAIAIAAGFFARRPLRIAWRETNPVRRALARHALAACGAVALGAIAGAVALAGVAWLASLAPTVLLGAIFLRYDLANDGRDRVAEVAGAAAFGFLPAAFALLAGLPPRSALALAFVMIARAVPTVLLVRAALRSAKAGERHVFVPLAAAVGVGVGAAAFHAVDEMPRACVVLLTVLALRAGALLLAAVPPRPRTVGIVEAIVGAAYVGAAALALR